MKRIIRGDVNMRRIISICLAMAIIISLVLGFAACNRGNQAEVGQNELSDATLDSLMFSLDGAIYTMPVHFSELEANGWRPYDTDNHFATDILESGNFAVRGLTDGSQNIAVTFTNLSEEVLLVSESYVIGIAVLFEVHNARLVLPGNVAIGSTYEDVIAAHGEPSRWHTFEDTYWLDFNTHSYGGVSLSVSIDNETNLVIFMDMTYWGWLE